MTAELKAELEALGPLAKQVVKVLATNGGKMNHLDIVKRLPTSPDRDIAEAFLQCRKSSLLYDTQPTAFVPYHTWEIAPFYLPQLQADLKALD